jgi:phage-related minor tail protein
MAQFNPSSGERTFKAGADLSAKQYRIVKLDSVQNQVVVATAATDKLLGVLLNNPVAGQEARVHMNTGTVKVVAAGVIALGAWVTADSVGKGTGTTSDKDKTIGIALEAAAADGDIIEVALQPHTLSL